jgi:AcrR family transcriptional regulator
MARTNPRPAQSTAPTKRSKRRVGRPSIAHDRRPQIVEAFAGCIRDYGLSGATMERIAERLGVSRSLVFHYFRNTAALLRAVVRHLVEVNVKRLSVPLQGVPIADRGQAILDLCFAGPHYAELQDVVLMAEMTSLAGRDKRVREMLAEGWEQLIEAIGEEIEAAFPAADREACRVVAYALTCLAEQNWYLTLVGPGAKRPRDARRAAEALLAMLSAGGPQTKKEIR